MNTEDYLKRVDYLIKVLHKKNILVEKTSKVKNRNKSLNRHEFFTTIMGLSKNIYKNWYNTGIKRVHIEHLKLLEEKYIDKKK